MKGPAALRKYLDSHGLSSRDFSRLSKGEIDEPAMSRYLAGKNTPGIKVAVLIERLTDGDVPVEVWVEPTSGKRRTGGDPVPA